MLTSSQFENLVSGRTRGFGPGALRLLLRLTAVPYAAAVHLRNRRFDTGKSQIHHLPVPVISVGNLTLGGTGKTPMVQWIARWFQQHGVQPMIISRGYRANSGSVNDEALELQHNLPDVPHLQNPDRVAAARTAVNDYNSQVLILDDAFQHRRIARDLDIVLLDASAPFGFGYLFPRGMLREPVHQLRRAGMIVLSRADMAAPDDRASIRQTALHHAPQAGWAEVCHAPRELLSASRSTQSLETLRDQPVALFCGIGNPAAFRNTVLACGCRVVAMREFPDHHHYGPSDLQSLCQWADTLDVAAVLCTHKDLVKLDTDRLGDQPLWAVSIQLEFLAGSEQLQARLQALLPT